MARNKLAFAIASALLLTSTLMLGRNAADAREAPPIDPKRPLLSQIKERMGTIKSLESDFTETRHLKLLKHKLVIKGKLLVQQDKLAWHVRSPLRYSCILSGNKITQWDADSNQVITISSKQFSGLKYVVEQLRMWFGGDLDQLQKWFDIKSDHAKRQILCTPKANSPQSDFIKSVCIVFKADLTYIDNITVTEANGDTMRIKFENTIINKPLSKEYWEIKWKFPKRTEQKPEKQEP